MPESKTLPCPMCPSCKHYVYNKNMGTPHLCRDCLCFSGKIKESTTSCYMYAPR